MTSQCTGFEMGKIRKSWINFTRKKKTKQKTSYLIKYMIKTIRHDKI